MPDDPKPYAWEIVVLRHDGKEETITRVAPTEKQARRRAIISRPVRSIVRLEPMTEAQYRRGYGYRYRHR